MEEVLNYQKRTYWDCKENCIMLLGLSLTKLLPADDDLPPAIERNNPDKAVPTLVEVDEGAFSAGW